MLAVTMGRLCAIAVLAASFAHAQPADALLQEGIVYLRAKDYEKAEAVLRRSYEMDNAARTLDSLAEALLGQGKNKAAVDVVAAEVAKYPQRRALRLTLGNTEVRAGNYDDGVRLFEGLIQETSDAQLLGDLYNRIGETYRRKGDVPKAITAFRDAKERLPKSVPVVVSLAMALDNAGQKQEAAENYRAALALEPNNPVVMNNLAFLLVAERGDMDEALRLAEKARQMLPKVDEIADTLASVYLKRNQTDEALEIFRDLVQRNPERADYRRNLADALDQRGGDSPAIQELKVALRVEPTPENGKKVLELLAAVPKSK